MLQSEAGDVNTAIASWFYGAFEGCVGLFVRRKGMDVVRAADPGSVEQIQGE